MSVLVTSSLITSVVLVMTSWMTCFSTVAATTTVSPTTSLSSSGDDDEFSDKGVCLTRYMNSANSSEGAGQNVVGVAAVIELRRPQGSGCGSVSGMDLQTVAALFWAVHRLNGQGMNPPLPPYIPGVRLELRVYDDCRHDVLAARHVGQLLASHPDFNCTPSTPPLAGILGTTTSHTTSFVASLLADTHIPHFGISATVSVLSNHTTYPTFFRTVPSDLTQSKVLLDLVLHLQWTYVVGIYTRDNYGIEGFQAFKRMATQAGVCVFKEKAFWHSDHGVQDSMERFVRELLIVLDTTRYPALGVIYFGHDTEATILFQMIQDRRSRWHDQDKVNQLYWLLSDGAGTSPSFASLAAPYNLIAIAPATSHLDDINNYFFHVLDNPEELGPYWQSLVSEYLHDVEGCFADRSPVSSCRLRDKIQPYDYLSAALDSFYSLAALLGRAHKEVCGGTGSPGVCSNLSDALKNGLLSLVQPQAMNYSLHFVEERLPKQFRHDRMLVPDPYGDFMPANSPVYFLNSASSGQWTKIGEYCNGSLDFVPKLDLPFVYRSECGTDCKQCRKSDTIRFVYHPGDILLLGLYSISSPVATASFSCGDYRKQSSSVAAMMAFLRAIETMMSQIGSGNGSRFGALVLDDCYNKLTASALLADLFSGQITLYDYNTDQPIPMDKVKAVIGSQSSSVTLSALSLLTPLQIPTISYSATSPDLDDRVSYPYFLRPVPSDSLQARALVDVALLLNVTYVGALYQDNNYGRRGMQEFVRMAEEEGICVETPVAVQVSNNEVDFHKAVRDIRNKDAMVVVVFLVESSVIKLLDAIEGMNLDLIFLASEAWSLSTDTLQDQRGVTARGSLVLTVDTSREAGNVGMANYFKELTTPALTGHELPWMRDFWENEKQCNLAGGFTNSYEKMCDPGDKLSNEVVRELSEDQKVVQTINAVASIITALEQQCGHHRDPVACMTDLHVDTAASLIRDVQLRDQRGQSFIPYLNDSNGNVGFTLHNVQKLAGNTYRYVEVGQYNPVQGLQITDDIKFYNPVGQPMSSGIVSTCLYKLQCKSVCGKGKTPTTPYPPVTPTSPIQQGDGEKNGGLVAAVVVMSLLCIALAAVLVVGVCCAKRRGRIPGLGVVKKDVSGPATRASGFGEVNMGFSPTSPRVSLPLPAIPQPSGRDTVEQYNLPDMDCRVSISRSSEASSSHCGGPSPSRFDEVSHYDYSEGEGRGRRPRRHHFHSSSQHQDLQRQAQELSLPQGLLQQHTAPSTASLPSAVSGKDRPRARSVPRADRPNFLPVQGPRPNTTRSVDMVGAQDHQHLTGRPRAYSHDAAFRERLGALSDDDQQILLKYLTTARQHSKSPRASQVPSMSPVMQNREGGGRPTFSLPPVQSQMSEVEGRGVVSPNIMFENPPYFCSNKTSLSTRPEDDPSLFYLHAIPAEKDLYLEVIGDPSDILPSSVSPHSPATVSPHSEPATSPCSPLSASSHFPSPVTWPLLAVTSSPQSLLFSSPVGIPAGPVPKTSPSTSGSSNITSVTSLLSPQITSPLSLPTSVRDSTASESSGAVFVSPDHECPPLKLSGPTDSLSPPVFHSPLHFNINPGFTPSPSVPQEQTRTTPVMQGKDISMSPTQHVALSPERLQQLINRNSKSQAAKHSTPQTSPQSAVPGVVVRDHTGALFWVPNVVVPLSQHSLPVSPTSTSSVSNSPTVAGSSHSLNHSDFGHSPTEDVHARNSFPQGSGHVTQSALPLQGNGMAQFPLYTHSPTNGLSQDCRQQSTANSSPKLQAKSRKPKMGVDALSAQRKLTDIGDVNLNMQRELGTPAALSSSGEHLNCVSSTPKTSTHDVLTDHPGSPQATEAGPVTVVAPPLSALGPSTLGPPSSLSAVTLHGDSDSGAYVRSCQLVPSPSPCKPLSVPQVSGSGDSTHTSGDSGTGEDLNTDADGNVHAMFEVCV